MYASCVIKYIWAVHHLNFRCHDHLGMFFFFLFCFPFPHTYILVLFFLLCNLLLAGVFFVFFFLNHKFRLKVGRSYRNCSSICNACSWYFWQEYYFLEIFWARNSEYGGNIFRCHFLQFAYLLHAHSVGLFFFFFFILSFLVLLFIIVIIVVNLFNVSGQLFLSSFFQTEAT